jgi:Fe-S-cluster-containing dehydrogenase component
METEAEHMIDMTVKVCDGCQADLEAVGYTVVRFPAMLPTIGKCDFCKKRRAIYTAALGKPALDKPCGQMVRSKSGDSAATPNRPRNFA